jgi:prepilin-type N-terminal cleavage/methylation domain-containing protein
MENKNEQGFTVIEMLVTVIVAATFAFMFYQLFIGSTKLNDSARRDAIASEIAYSNLRKYPTADSVTGLAACTSPTPTATLLSATPTYDDIGQVTETITASYPFACDNPDVIKLESSLSYKGSANKVSYVAYLK